VEATKAKIKLKAARMSHRKRRMKFYTQDTLFAVVRLAARTPVPEWAWAGAFCSVTRSEDELSIVCDEARVPVEITSAERGFRLLAVEGPLDFSLTGILASIAAPLAAAEISLFAISTFDTDYLLVRADRSTDAVSVLRDAGWEIN
jgi:uncharacterized protein